MSKLMYSTGTYKISRMVESPFSPPLFLSSSLSLLSLSLSLSLLTFFECLLDLCALLSRCTLLISLTRQMIEICRESKVKGHTVIRIPIFHGTHTHHLCYSLHIHDLWYLNTWVMDHFLEEGIQTHYSILVLFSTYRHIHTGVCLTVF